jgi:NAD(P)-dependent dehydrogenase (short-subunit alcohol dehydrogenase family)
VKEAASEIKKVARENPVLGAEGAVTFLERVSPALEHVDGSSGAIGTAVNNAIVALVPVIAKAPAEIETRREWLERLWEAHAADPMPYIELLADYWGELCGSKEIASAWGDQLLTVTRLALSPDKALRGHFHGTSACLSALYRAERSPHRVKMRRPFGMRRRVGALGPVTATWIGSAKRYFFHPV